MPTARVNLVITAIDQATRKINAIVSGLKKEFTGPSDALKNALKYDFDGFDSLPSSAW